MVDGIDVDDMTDETLVVVTEFWVMLDEVLPTLLLSDVEADEPPVPNETF